MKANNTIIRQQQIALNCSTDWNQYKNHCYKLFSLHMTNYQAQSYCHSKIQNSYLADIKSNDEFEWIRSFLLNITNQRVWVL